MMNAIAIFAIELNNTDETYLRQKDCNTFTLRLHTQSLCRNITSAGPLKKSFPIEWKLTHEEIRIDSLS